MSLVRDANEIAAMQAEARKQSEQAATLQRQLAELAKSNEVAQAEKQHLAGQLQLAEVEKRSATEMAVRMQEEVKVQREQNAKLTDGVKALAGKSGELAQEIRENRPLAPNTIFNDFLANRVQHLLLDARLFGRGNGCREALQRLGQWGFFRLLVSQLLHLVKNFL